MSTQRYGIPTKGRYSPFLDVTPRSQTPNRVLPPTLFPSSSRFSPSAHQPIPQPLLSLFCLLASTFTRHLYPSPFFRIHRLSAALLYTFVSPAIQLVCSRPSFLSLSASLIFYYLLPYTFAKSDALLQDVGSRGISLPLSRNMPDRVLCTFRLAALAKS